MSIASLINRPCVIVQRSDEEIDEFSTARAEEDARTETVCELQQRRRDEPDRLGESSETLWDLFFLPGEDLSTAESVIVDGLVYELVGDPWEARNPRTQQVSHIEATAKQTGTEDPGS